MQAGIKHYNYYSTMLAYSDVFEFLKASKCNAQDVDIFHMLYYGYNVDKLLVSAYFEVLRVSDGKYELNIQKYVNDTYSIKFVVNPNYANVLERFTNE